jgi:hypothetical protein
MAQGRTQTPSQQVGARLVSGMPLREGCSRGNLSLWYKQVIFEIMMTSAFKIVGVSEQGDKDSGPGVFGYWL